MDDRDRLAEFLTRYHPTDGTPLSPEEAHAAADRMLVVARASDAELYANGYRFLTVAHGDLEDADDERRLHRLSALADAPRTLASISFRGTNDTSTWIVNGAQAAATVDQLEALAHELNPGWWKIRRTAR